MNPEGDKLLKLALLFPLIVLAAAEISPDLPGGPCTSTTLQNFVFCVCVLQSKQVEEVAVHLHKIFLLLGPPVILESDNGGEFVNGIITTLAAEWSSMKLVYGHPRHAQSQGAVKSLNAAVRKLWTWMVDTGCKDWANGVHVVQFTINTISHATTGTTPYEAMFGKRPQFNLHSMALTGNVLTNIHTEETLEQALDEAGGTEHGRSTGGLDFGKEVESNGRETSHSPSTQQCVWRGGS